MDDWIPPFNDPLEIKNLEADLQHWKWICWQPEHKHAPTLMMCKWTYKTKRQNIHHPDTLRMWKKAKHLIFVQDKTSKEVEAWRPIKKAPEPFDPQVDYSKIGVDTMPWYELKNQQSVNDDNLRLHGINLAMMFERYQKILNTYEQLKKSK